VLRKVAEAEELKLREVNRAFVLMQYFGYLRRDPDSAGYQFWLNKLNAFNGDFVASEMVKAFIKSSEYRQRFGPS
jgi:DNA-binding IclR family transcriptional regulator